MELSGWAVREDTVLEFDEVVSSKQQRAKHHISLVYKYVLSSLYIAVHAKIETLSILLYLQVNCDIDGS